MQKYKKYIIITPAKNEEEHIEKTIISVVNQTVLPLCWVIVDDGSSDATPDIVKKYLSEYPFIRLIQTGKKDDRHFGNKVYAINKGFEEVKDLEYDYYCNLDADISFDSHYFEYLLKKFEENSRLGICGGKIYDNINGKFVPQKSKLHSVGGPVQFFRKECYESFGGYKPSPIGFIDGYAEISARKNGWETQTFPELIVLHHRPEGKLRGSDLKHCFQGGQIEYLFGYSYTYHLFRNLPRIFSKPYIIGYLATLWGYHSLLFKGSKKLVDDDFIKYLRKEQNQRLTYYLKTLFR